MLKFSFKFSLVLTLMLTASFAFAGKGFKVNFSESSDKSFAGPVKELDYEINDYKIVDVKESGKDYSQIKFGGNVTLDKKGFASLPFISASIVLDDNVDVKLEVVSKEYKNYKLKHPLLPSKGTIYRNQNPDDVAFEIDPKSITNSWYPGKIAKMTKPFIVKDVRGLSVFVYPFQYNAKKNVLRVLKKITVRLVNDFTKSTNPIKTTGNKIIAPMDSLYSSMFLNYKRDNLNLGEFGDILVIYTARDKAAIQPYILWKKEKGFNVSEKEVATGTNVKDLIKTEYEKNNDILYVQLVGDWEDIKSDSKQFGSVSDAPMDPMMGCVVGDDNYADLIVGRFSAKNPAEVSVQIEKAINYEKNPELGGEWYSKAVGIASNEGQGRGDDGEGDEQHMEIIKNNRLLPYGYQTVHNAYQAEGATDSQLGANIDAGLGLINYVGHGSNSSFVTTGFNNEDIAGLTNGNKLPFIVSVACVNGQFQISSKDSFAETWLKKENGGAVVTWMSTINQPWKPPMRGQDYFNDLLIGGYDYSTNPGEGNNINTSRTTFGSLSLNASHLMYAESSNADDLKTIQTWTIFGDASLQVRTKAPARLSLTSKLVMLGAPFNTSISSSNGKVDGILVSISQNGKAYTGVTDASGKIKIEHKLLPGKAKLTVTGFNAATVYEDIAVIAPKGAYLTLENVTKSKAIWGKDHSVSVRLKNVGVDASSKIALVMQTNDQMTAVNSNKVIVSGINSDGVVDIKDAFSFRISENVADQEILPVVIKAYKYSTNEEIDWDMSFNVVVNAASLELGPVQVYNEGTVKPGDTIRFGFEVSNNGHANAENISVKMVESSLLGIEINEEIGIIEALPANGKTRFSFVGLIPSNVEIGSVADFKYSVTADKSIFNNAVGSFTIGMSEDFENSFDKWNLSGDINWAKDGEVKFDGSFSGKAGKVIKNQSTAIEANVSYASAGKISFYRKVSSEKRYDKLTFYVDGIKIADWSGEEDWAKVEYDISAGDHTIKFEYKKDSSVDKGKDTAWLDNLLLKGGSFNN